MKNIEILKTKTILYAEDELGIRQSVSEILRLFFDKVVVTDDGKKALNLAYEQKFDVLMFDICMPNLNGLDALKEIRKTNNKVPAIIMSAYDEKHYLKEAINLNVFKYIDKPFSKEIFLNSMADLAQFFVQMLGECNTLLYENVFYDIVNKSILIKEETRNLTKKEYIVLEKLIEKRAKVVSFDELLDATYEFGEGSKDALKAVIKSLRKKIEPATIENRFGSGYLLDECKKS